MKHRATTNTVAQSFSSVKSPTNNQLPPVPNSVIHHKSFLSRRDNLIVCYIKEREGPYGVSSAPRSIPPGLFLKRYDYFRQGLRVLLGLSPGQIEVTMRLLRLYVYYGAVYPKAATVVGEDHPTAEQTCWRASQGLGEPPRRGEIGRATFWRTIAILKELGLIQVVNRFVIRHEAQISNLYRLDKLAIMLAKYLAEHTGHIWPEWLEPYLLLPWPELWESLTQSPGARAGPGLSVS